MEKRENKSLKKDRNNTKNNTKKIDKGNSKKVDKKFDKKIDNVNLKKEDNKNNVKKSSFIKKIFGNNDYTYSFSEVVVITICSMFVGALTLFSLVLIISGGRNYFMLSDEMKKIYDVFYTLKENTYDGVTDKSLAEAGVKGMVESVGDTYTSYMDSDDTSEFEKTLEGYYEGIGCTIQKKDDYIEVIEVFKDGPADKASIKVGDKIKKVDEIEVNNEMLPAELSDYIMNKATGEIAMVLLRGEEEVTVKLEKGKVPEQVVTSRIIEKDNHKVGYLGITLFSSHASSQFEEKLEQLNKQDIEALIIDVRGNNGGHLSTAKDIASQLVASGKNLYQVEKNGKVEITKDKTKTKVDYPVAILVNGGSASASEVLTAAIKESIENSFVVGTKTFGKGTVQQTKKLPDGSMIKYTALKWLTPNGNSINGVGIDPTDLVEFDYQSYIDSKYQSDNQLDKAFELVVNSENK